jgi:hypothetical protein
MHNLRAGNGTITTFDVPGAGQGVYTQDRNSAFIVVGPRGSLAVLGGYKLTIAVLFGISATNLAKLDTPETVLKKVKELDFRDTWAKVETRRSDTRVTLKMRFSRNFCLTFQTKLRSFLAAMRPRALSAKIANLSNPEINERVY